MAYQNVAHRNASQGARVITAHDGKLYLSFTHGNTHMTQTVMAAEQARHDPRSLLHSVPGQSLTSAQSALPPSVNQAGYPLPKHHKGSSQAGQPLRNNTSNVDQTEKLMHLLMYKDSQISALNSKLESMHSTLQSYRAKENETLRQNKLFQSELEAKDKENQTLMNELTSVKSGKRKLALEKGKLDKLLEGKSADLIEMTQKTESLEAEMESLRKTNVEIWDERRELMQKFEEVEANCKSHSETFEKQSQGLFQSRTALQKLEQEKRRIDAEKRKLEKSKEEAFQTVQVLKSVIKQKENRIDQLQGKMKEMTKESNTLDIAICECPDKKEKQAMRQSLIDKEESEAKLGDMLAKLKNQISCLTMEKEKARQQMTQAWESENNLKAELDKEKAERGNMEKQLGKMRKLEKEKVRLVQQQASGDAELEEVEKLNAKLTKQIQELQAKLKAGSSSLDEPVGKQKEERCKKLYKDLMRYHVTPGQCKGVAQCVLKNMLNLSMKLPGKEFAWTAQRPPTPHVSDEDEEGDGEVDETCEEDHLESEVISDDETQEILSSKKVTVQSTDRKRSELTDKLELYGGLWCTPDEMEDHLEKLDNKEKEKAVIVQLQYRCIVLELARESKLLHSSLTGKQKPFQELKASLLKLIRQNEEDAFRYKSEKLVAGESRMEAISQERKRMYSPGPDHPILRPRKKQSSRRTGRKVSFECLHGKVIDHFVYDSNGCRDWHRGIVVEQARCSMTILYEFAKESPVKLLIKDAKDDFEKGDLVVCEVTLQDFVGKVIENLWLMEEGVTEWWKGHVLKMGDSKGEDTDYEVAYSESKDEEFIYFVPLYKDYWCNEVRILSL